MSALSASEPYFIAEDKTPFYADTVEWCPFKSFNNVFVCGTYQLDEEQSSSKEGQVRHGNAILYKLGTTGSYSNSKITLSVEDRISTSGILDMKWSSSLLYSNVALALVSSDGKVLLKYLKEDENGISLSHVTDLQLAESEEKILLSVDWAKQQDNSAAIITSDNKGSLHYLQVRETEMCVVCSWKAHNFESWVASFNYSDQNIVYSGGDDCYFKAWDLRSLSSPIFVKKNHTMGVTAISKSKLNENLLVSGSYDENVSLWDARQFKTPLSNLNIGGGIWRLKWHPTNPQYLLSAAMHNGFHVLSLKNDRLKLEQSYNHHKSLAYGADWSHLTIESHSSDHNNQLQHSLNKLNIRNVIASCSFYDNLLSVWGISLL